MKPLIPLLLLPYIVVTAADIHVTVPNNLDLPAEGNSVSWPFTFQDLGITTRRYQQVYDASQFSSIPSGGYINQVWFRADMLGHGGPNAADSLDSVQMNMSLTTRSPDTLSAVFSENVGIFDSVVYGPSPLEVSSIGGWLVISLSQPFSYLPAAGNLLVDIQTRDTTPYSLPQQRLDAEDTLGDSISTVMANDINAPSGFVRTLGLITHFRIEPIPEPSTWALMGLGLFGMWRFLVRKNNQQNDKYKD